MFDWPRRFNTDYISFSMLQEEEGAAESAAGSAMNCATIYLVDRLLLFVEGMVFIGKNVWFLARLLLNRQSLLMKENGFTDLSYLKEYRGQHMKWIGEEEQCNDGEGSVTGSVAGSVGGNGGMMTHPVKVGCETTLTASG